MNALRDLSSTVISSLGRLILFQLGLVQPMTKAKTSSLLERKLREPRHRNFDNAYLDLLQDDANLHGSIPRGTPSLRSALCMEVGPWSPKEIAVQS